MLFIIIIPYLLASSTPADMHLAEVTAIRRELSELEREHSRAKQAYEEKIADLKRQIETIRAHTGQGPPIPSVIPATTNHFGALMGHPHGMFGQGGSTTGTGVDIERSGIEGMGGSGNNSGRDSRLGMRNGVNGGGLPASSAAATAAAAGSAAAGSAHASSAGRPGPYHPDTSYDRDRDGYQQQLGKRSRLEEARDTYDGQPPSAKSRLGDTGRPIENGEFACTYLRQKCSFEVEGRPLTEGRPLIHLRGTSLLMITLSTFITIIQASNRVHQQLLISHLCDHHRELSHKR